jgi:hypothetical protein
VINVDGNPSYPNVIAELKQHQRAASMPKPPKLKFRPVED